MSKPCPKCGRAEPLRGPTYIPPTVRANKFGRRDVPECLEWRCGTCGYATRTACKDAKP